MGNHLAADLAEATQTIGDLQEPVFVQGRDIASDIPAVAQDFGGFVRPAKVAPHHVGTAHKQQAGLTHRQGGETLRINNSHANAWQRMADLAALAPDLSKTRGAEIVRVYGNHGGAFRGAIPFQRPDPKLVVKSSREPLGQFFRAGHEQAQTAEIFRRTTTRVQLQEGRCGK